MIRNYLKVAVRNLLKHRAYSLINILGLSFGLACCLLIFVYVMDELSYDKFHEKAERIHRLQYNIVNFNIVQTPPPMAAAMKEYFSEIEHIGRMFARTASVEIAEGSATPSRFSEERLFFVDSSIFDIFSFEIVQGQREKLLHEPNTVVINEEVAERYFGASDPIGKTIRLEGRSNFKVIAVARDFPTNSHWHFNMLFPYDNMYDLETESIAQVLRQNFKINWMISHSFTYMTLKEGQSADAVNARFGDFVKKYIPENQLRDQTFNLQPLLDIRLNADVNAQIEPVGNITYIYLFIAVAFATLLIACINFINLSTARSLQRVKEVGMRRVLGAWKTQLIWQFLGESALMSFIAFVLALVLAVYSLPVLNELTAKEMSLLQFSSFNVLAGFISLFVLTAVLSGLYPAFFATRIQPVKSLKGEVSQSMTKGGHLRRLLVVVQFTVAIILITGTVIIYNQVQLFRNRPLGFQKEQVLTIPLFSPNIHNSFGGIDGNMRQRLNTLEDKLATNPRILSTTLSGFAPGLGVGRHNVQPEGFTTEEILIVPALSVDYDFVSTYNLDIIEGRDFDQSFGTDHTSAFIINETAVKNFRYETAEEALGKSINLEGKEGKVVGVVKDFHFESLRGEIDALVMDIKVPTFTILSARIEAHDVPETIDFIRSNWEEQFPEKTFEYNFLDDQLQDQYQTEEKLGEMINYFAVMAILISCLGSYGLVMFLARQKMKEIGIRKVLGASVRNIIFLLSKNFLILITISFVLSVPIAYYFINDWLEAFTYRVSIGAGSFLLAGLIALMIVMITISYQALRAAFSNPVNSLRQE